MSKTDVRKRTRTSSDDSDDDSDFDNRKIYADGYDENFMGDAKDRAWFNTLSEREREAELLKRHEQREIIKRREEINKRLKSKAEESAVKSEEEGEIDDDDDDDDDDRDRNKSKRSLSNINDDVYAEDDEDDYRSSANRRKQINASKQKDTEHSRSLQLLMEGRRKKQEEKHKKSMIKSDDLSSSDDDGPTESLTKNKVKDEIWNVKDVYRTSSSEGEDDDDDDDDDRSRNRRLRSRSPEDGSSDNRELESRRKKSTPIHTRDQLKAMILSRFRMEKWCHSPFFADVAKGAFVRINIGQNNGEPVYRVCEIRDVVETGKVYNLGSTRTNKGLRLKHANNERVFRLEYVSNSEISDHEFQRWKEAMIKQGVALPTLNDMEDKMKSIDKFKNYKYNDKDITKMVEEKKRFRRAPINFAMTKTELLSEIAIAKEDNDLQREEELKKKLSEMEEQADALDRKRTENISIMAEINRRNRQNTQKNIELALIREAQEQRNKPADPFTRLRCAPTLVTKTPQLNTREDLLRGLQQERRAAEAAAQKKKLEEQIQQADKSKIATPVVSTVSETSLSTATTTSERGSFTSFSDQHDEMFTSHDFELDLVI